MIGASLNEASDRPFLNALERRSPRFSCRAINLGEWSLSVLSHRHSMTPPEQAIPGKDEPPPNLVAARRSAIIQEAPDHQEAPQPSQLGRLRWRPQTCTGVTRN
jgi:hypothetical protein